MPWVTATVRAGAEKQAVKELEGKGFQCKLPLEKRERSRSHGRRASDRDADPGEQAKHFNPRVRYTSKWVEVPHIPRYLFVFYERSWQEIELVTWMPNLWRDVMNPIALHVTLIKDETRPFAVTADSINLLMKQAENAHKPGMKSLHAGPMPGSRVCIRSGPLAGKTGLILRRSRRRVQVLLDVFGEVALDNRVQFEELLNG